jgi:hypothetical protein
LSPREEKVQVKKAGSSKATSRRAKAASKVSKSTTKAKGKGKAVAAAEDEDVDMEDVNRKGVAEGPEGAEEEESGEEELEDAEERKAASKKWVLNPSCVLPPSTDCLVASAEAALDRRDEMDVEGWKVGDPYVPLFVLERVLHVADAFSVYRMLHSQKRSRLSRRLRSG